MELESQIPGRRIFHQIPNFERKRIFGAENEYGTEEPKSWLLPVGIGLHQAGGRIYDDLEHLEYATPEAPDPLSVVVNTVAGQRICANLATRLFKHNNDWHENSFAAHENYFTRTRMELMDRLIPFLVTRQILTGAGWVNPEGQFEISQRARYTNAVRSHETVETKPILNLRDERLSEVSGWWRWHYIGGDANRCQIAEFLKFGLTGLMIDLIEDGKLPIIPYDEKLALQDLKSISRKRTDWTLEGTEKGKAAGLDVLEKHIDAAWKEYFGRDELTTEILLRAKRYIGNLRRREYDELFGVLDWVTKYRILDFVARNEGISWKSDAMQANDLAYHDIKARDTSFADLDNNGGIERIVSDKLIEQATLSPLPNSRAFFRGKILEVFKTAKFRDGLGLMADWDFIGIGYVWPHSKADRRHNLLWHINLDNPWNNYAEKLPEAVREIRKFTT